MFKRPSIRPMPAEVGAAAASPALQAIAQRCRRRVSQRALFAAGVAAVPVPGLDWLTDVAVLVKLLGEINTAFGLTPGQIERLAPDRRLVVYKAISAGGSLLVGRVVTQQLVLTVLKLVGVRLTAQQAAKYVPIAGQAVSAALTFSALKFVCEQHIRQCMAVAQQLALPEPARPQGAGGAGDGADVVDLPPASRPAPG